MLKLVSFKTLSDPLVRVGALLPSGHAVVDFSKYTSSVKGYVAPPSSITTAALTNMNRFISSGEDSLKWVQEVLQRVEAAPSDPLYVVDLKQARLTAPIPTPRRNIFCVGKNYKDHIKEVAAADHSHGTSSSSTTTTTPPPPPAAAATPAYPKYPQFFTKATTTVVGPEDNVDSHSKLTKWLDYEAELAVVIGKQGRDIPREKALDHVYAYTIANDITSRDVQRHHGQWFKGKSLDTTCPMGPYLLLPSPSSSFDPQNLSIKCWINNDLRQNSNTKEMIFDIAELISQLSAGLTLLPGDILLTGTPEGVGYARKPPELLKSGDEMRIEIEHLGTLTNKVV
eukprot:gene11510-12885_t